jgi:hypothetical protein
MVALLSGLPWPEVVGNLWKTIRELIPSRSSKGMYVIWEGQVEVVAG